MVFGNGVKNIQAAAYNGARTVYNTYKVEFWFVLLSTKIKICSKI